MQKLAFDRRDKKKKKPTLPLSEAPGLKPQFKPKPAFQQPQQPQGVSSVNNITPSAGGKTTSKPPQERVTQHEDASGNPTSYTIEFEGRSTTISKAQWDRLREAKKGRGSIRGDPVLERLSLQNQRIIAQQRLTDPRVREQAAKEALAAQGKEKIQEELAPRFEQPRDIVTGELPEVAATPSTPSSFFTNSVYDVMPEGRVKDKLVNIAQAGVGVVGAVPGLKQGIRALNYNDWVKSDSTDQLMAEAEGEFRKIITDVMEGGENEVGAQLRFEKAKEMLAIANNNNQQLIQENPVFYGKEGEERAFELQLLINNIPVKAEVLNRVLTNPGEGRRAQAEELGLPQ